jgi:hypothetical protein
VANQNGSQGNGRPLNHPRARQPDCTARTSGARRCGISLICSWSDPDEYTDDEIDLIDDVFVRLVEPSNNPRAQWLPAPTGSQEAVLTQAERLDTGTLIECARTKHQEHLLAISRRKLLPEALTEVLVERGDQQVVLSAAKNSGAKFSAKGFETLVKRSHGDDALTACVGMRPDLPAAARAPAHRRVREGARD